jgi:exodeoxyribonuclease VII large subunit
MMPSPPVGVLRVGQAVALLNDILAELPLNVEGEISEYTLSRGKFVFFELKDEAEDSRLSCFMLAHQLSQPLENGMRVVVSGRPGLYQKSGKFRLSVTRVEPKGDGSRKRAYELLVAKLEAEGLFAAGRKRPLPHFPRRVGLVSSQDAAGLGDFLTIARQRLPVEFNFVNVAVQGIDAEREICAALDWLNSHQKLDVIVLLRGGGSIEDLRAFNGEPVARAIARSRTPVLVGVGHERDLTVADLAADLRASTPSNAAELLLITPEEVRIRVASLTRAGELHVAGRIQRLRYEVERHLGHLQAAVEGAVERYRLRTRALLHTIETAAPQATLERGYSLTSDVAGLIRDPRLVPPGTPLITQFAAGKLHSTVTNYHG